MGRDETGQYSTGQDGTYPMTATTARAPAVLKIQIKMIFQVKFLSPDLTSALVEKRAQVLARLRLLIVTFSMRTGDQIMIMMMLMTMMRIMPIMMQTILCRRTFPYIIHILFTYMITGDEHNHDVIVIAVACFHITHISQIYSGFNRESVL